MKNKIEGLVVFSSVFVAIFKEIKGCSSLRAEVCEWTFGMQYDSAVCGLIHRGAVHSSLCFFKNCMAL